MTLSPPKIVPPIGACSDRVRLQGQKTNAKIEIYVADVNLYETVFSGTASGPDEVFVLTRRLNGAENVFASQETPTDSSRAAEVWFEKVQPEPDTSEIKAVTADAHLHACGRCGAFGSAFPGAEVLITSEKNGELGRGIVDSQSGAARVEFAVPLLEGETLSAMQTVCGRSGPRGPLPRPDLPQTQDRKLPPPTIRLPLHRCERAVWIGGVADGATVSLFRRGQVYASGCFHYPALWFEFPDPLTVDEPVWADQRFPTCELFSKPSNTVVVDDDDVPVPEILGRLCQGMSSIGVGNLRFGATVRVLQVLEASNTGPDDIAQGFQVAEIEAWDDICDIPLNEKLNPDRGKYAVALQFLCEKASTPSGAEPIEPRNLPKPFIDGPVYECSCIVRVRDIHPGARVEIYQMCARSPGWRMIAAQYVYDRSADLKVAPPLQFQSGEKNVFARQIACSQPIDGEPVAVMQPPADLLPPIIEDCGDHISVSGTVPGALVEVYLDGKYLIGGRSGASKVFIDLPQPLPAGAKVQARQILCDRISALGPEFDIRVDVQKRGLAWVSTNRICQLTGSADPEGKPMVNSSLLGGIESTDLGVVVDHDTGDRLLYFFFGDTNVPDPDAIDWPVNADTIARTNAQEAGPNGPELDFLSRVDEGGMFNNAHIVPVIFGIHNVSQGGFEVPTGGFSHAGKLYIFATTEAYQINGQDSMGRSLLVSAQRAGDMFYIVPGHGWISHHDNECLGTFKFINIAAQKIRNDDWEHLPDNADPGGEGLILIGSGRYRESQPCLAYVPLRPTQDPVFSDWRYLSGFDATPGASRLCGLPRWSDRQEDAVFLFDDSKSKWFGNNKAVVGELSVAFLPQIRRWMLLYGGVVVRWADYPWGPWSEAIALFDFSRDHASPGDPNDTRPRFIQPGGGPYGPYIIPRFTEYDALTHEVTIYYTMSTWKPYQVMLMKTVLKENCQYVNAFQCPNGVINTDICPP